MTIRKQPADFRVEEILEPAFLHALAPLPSPSHTHALYSLTKSSLSTPEAIARLAKSLALRPGLIDYAGLKDKHALTTQHVSIPLSGQDHLLPASIESLNISASRLGFSAHPIQADAIARNRFTIVVRDLSKQAAAEIVRRADLLSIPSAQPDAGSLLILNYFGDQRFGSARHKQGFVARAVIDDDYELALRLAIGTPARKDSGKTRTFTRALASHWGDWAALARSLPRCPERAPIEALARGESFRDAFARLPSFLLQMYLEAFQSHLWNAAARFIALAIAEESSTPVLRSTDAFGDLLFPHAACVAPDWRNCIMPVLAKSTELAQPWGDFAQRALREENLQLSDLRVPGLRRPFFGESPRPLFIAAEQVVISPPQLDELAATRRSRQTISFLLPRGCYATVLLRALGQ